MSKRFMKPLSAFSAPPWGERELVVPLPAGVEERGCVAKALGDVGSPGARLRGAGPVRPTQVRRPVPRGQTRVRRPVTVGPARLRHFGGPTELAARPRCQLGTKQFLVRLSQGISEAHPDEMEQLMNEDPG